jgi:hypothetical protein
LRVWDNITLPEGRDPALFTQPKSGGKGIADMLTTPETIRTLQRKLYRKAKQEPAFRFHALYDKRIRWGQEDSLGSGLQSCKPGIISLCLQDCKPDPTHPDPSTLGTAIRAGLNRNGPWAMARRLAAQSGMTNKWLKEQGLISVKELWVKIHYPATRLEAPLFTQFPHLCPMSRVDPLASSL